MDQEIKILNLVGYARVSTLTQREKETVKQQVYKLKRYAEYNEKTVNLVDIFIDDGVSGFKFFHERPKGIEVKKKLLEPEIDGILSTELSRIGRANKVIDDFIEFIETNKKELVLLKEKIDTSTPMGRAMLGFMKTMIVWDAESTIEKLQTSRQYAKDVKGVKMGRKTKTIPQDIEKRVKQWYDKGFGLTVICRWINEMNFQIPNLKYQKDPENEPETIQFKIVPRTLAKRLRELDVVIRDPKHRLVGKKKINKKVIIDSEDDV